MIKLFTNKTNNIKYWLGNEERDNDACCHYFYLIS